MKEERQEMGKITRPARKCDANGASVNDDRNANRAQTPDHAACNARALALWAKGEAAEAEACWRTSLELNPDYWEALNNLGKLLYDEGRHKEAADCFERGLVVAPTNDAAVNNLAMAWMALGQTERAEKALSKWVRDHADSAHTQKNLGGARFGLGDVDSAIACFRKALEIDPGMMGVRRSLMFAQGYSSGVSNADIFREHTDFAQRFETGLRTAWRAHENRPDTERRLRIAYLSGDFHAHAMAFAVEALLACHDHDSFEVFCYSTNAFADEVTGRLTSHADHWRNLVGVDDDAAAELIRNDAIDVLVDLSGHTAMNRALVFARKPAPVQVAWLGYMHTSGLAAIDYRVTDRWTDPVGTSERFHSEVLWRLPSVMVYRPPDDAPAVTTLPSIGGAPFTFACLNNPAKMGPQTIELWAQILRAVPDARLMLGNTGNAAIRRRFRGLFRDRGVDASRIMFKRKLSMPRYLALHHQIDLALDPFPYNGGVTSCHTLWMGVPFVTLAGERYVGRLGESLLHNVSLAQFIAHSPEQYVELACGLAADRAQLAAIRASLRERLATSRLLDAKGFAQGLESAYRAMWRNWCANPSFDFARTT